jgi:hypothetical protein
MFLLALLIAAMPLGIALVCPAVMLLITACTLFGGRRTFAALAIVDLVSWGPLASALSFTYWEPETAAWRAALYVAGLAILVLLVRGRSLPDGTLPLSGVRARKLQAAFALGAPLAALLADLIPALTHPAFALILWTPGIIVAAYLWPLWDVLNYGWERERCS